MKKAIALVNDVQARIEKLDELFENLSPKILHNFSSEEKVIINAGCEGHNSLAEAALTLDDVIAMMQEEGEKIATMMNNMAMF